MALRYSLNKEKGVDGRHLQIVKMRKSWFDKHILSDSIAQTKLQIKRQNIKMFSLNIHNMVKIIN